MKRPIIVHNRKADVDVVKILKKEASEVGGAIHGFSGDSDLAMKFIDMGFYVSIGKRDIETGNRDLQETVQRIPLEKMLIETDSSEPADVKKVAEQIATLKKLTFEEVAHATTANLKTQFKI